MEKQEQAERFMKYVADNYDELKASNKRHAEAKLGGFDEDIFSDTILKVYEKIMKDGLTDDTEAGMANYLFKAFKQNCLREKQYARNKKSDDGVDQDMLLGVYEDWYDRENISSKEKLISDLRKDYFALRIAEIVEKEFDSEHFYLWRLKTFMPMTYKQIQEKTKIPSARQKILEVNEYLRQNVKKEELEKEFQTEFELLIDF